VTFRLGCQGWNYPAWVGALYPERTRAADFLGTYARAFGTVEIDSTFYAVPARSTVESWAARVPEGFVFSPKLPQEVTHDRRLVGAGDIAALFFERMRALGPKLGIVLCQLAPDFTPAEFAAFAAFLPTLPTDVRVAVEFRHKGWITEAVHRLCTDHGVAIAVSDARWIPRKWTLQLATRPTAPFAYVRWMGPDRSITDYSHVQVDRTREIEEWVPVLAEMRRRIPLVLGYCNNHYSGHAPHTVRTLLARLGEPVVLPEALRDQTSLF
jgi:uncharacterized protein YecE (DUF72 family)